ncbi:MAG: prephenate dehydratase, partial [Chitinophagaceae bacterium]
FAELNVNLTKIQSMPVLGKRNEYYFYVDMEWKSMENYDTAIRKALKYTVNFNIMGEYLKNDKV